MGQDKSLLPFGGYKTLLEYQYTRLSPLFKKTYISTKYPGTIEFNAPIIEDNFKDIYAPSVGFVSAFEALKDEDIFVIGVDMPFIDKEHISKLLEALEDDAVIAQTKSTQHPLCGIYTHKMYKIFKESLSRGEHKVKKVLLSAKVNVVNFDDERVGVNLNYYHQYLTHHNSLKI